MPLTLRFEVRSAEVSCGYWSILLVASAGESLEVRRQICGAVEDRVVFHEVPRFFLQIALLGDVACSLLVDRLLLCRLILRRLLFLSKQGLGARRFFLFSVGTYLIVVHSSIFLEELL